MGWQCTSGLVSHHLNPEPRPSRFPIWLVGLWYRQWLRVYLRILGDGKVRDGSLSMETSYRTCATCFRFYPGSIRDTESYGNREACQRRRFWLTILKCAVCQPCTLTCLWTASWKGPVNPPRSCLTVGVRVLARVDNIYRRHVNDS